MFPEPFPTHIGILETLITTWDRTAWHWLGEAGVGDGMMITVLDAKSSFVRRQALDRTVFDDMSRIYIHILYKKLPLNIKSIFEELRGRTNQDGYLYK